jgi:hypothetical protein
MFRQQTLHAYLKTALRRCVTYAKECKVQGRLRCVSIRELELSAVLLDSSCAKCSQTWTDKIGFGQRCVCGSMY